MRDVRDTSRRAFLQLITLLGVGGGVAFLFGACASETEPGDQRASDLLQTFSDRSAVRPLAREVLRAFPQLGDRETVTRALLSHPRWSSDRRVADLLVEQIREDLDEGRIIQVKGWVISETEGNLLALSALVPARLDPAR